MGAADDGPFRVGLVTSPHPHAALHLRTLDALPAVEAIHACALAGADPAALAAGSP
jgi:hypothetical protein